VRIRFWGTRGSIPSPGPHTVRYGGNTPCAELRTNDGRRVILDAGTGIRALGRALATNGGALDTDILLSHTHWDHVQGLPFFAPIFQSGNRVTIWAMAALDGTAERMVREQFGEAAFPVTFEELPATVAFRSMGDAFAVGGLAIRTIPLRHPGGAIGYRFSEDASGAGALVYISDNELGAAVMERSGQAAYAQWYERLVEFARGAHTLVHDAMYTPEEYERHRGWGHSSDTKAVELAADAAIQRLVLYHHHPERSDDELDARVAVCRALAAARGVTLDVVAAAEGLEL